MNRAKVYTNREFGKKKFKNPNKHQRNFESTQKLNRAKVFTNLEFRKYSKIQTNTKEDLSETKIRTEPKFLKTQKLKPASKKFWTNPEFEQSQSFYKLRIQKKIKNPNKHQGHFEQTEKSNRDKVCTNLEFRKNLKIQTNTKEILSENKIRTEPKF